MRSGHQLPAPLNTDSLPPDAPRGRDAERLLYAQQLAEFRDFTQRQTEFIGRLVGNLVNNTLEVASAAFDTNLVITREFHAPIGSVIVDNQSTHTVYVKSGQPTGSVPNIGSGSAAAVGFYPVPANSQRQVGIGDHSVTFYGNTAGDVLAWQALTTGVRSNDHAS